MGLPMSSLPHDLIVSTLAGSRISTSYVCLDCPIQIDSHYSVIDFVCLPMHDINIILRMNWLSTNHVFF